MIRRDEQFNGTRKRMRRKLGFPDWSSDEFFIDILILILESEPWLP
jgi:hypothetical protein